MPRPTAHGRADKPSHSDARTWRTGFPQRWLLWVLAAVICMSVMAAIAGDQAGAVFQTYIYAIFTLPVLAAAGMLGMLLTAPFAARDCFASSPQPAGFRALVAVALGLGTFALATLLLGTIHLVEPAGNAWPLLAIPLVGAAAGFVPTRTFFRALDRTFFTGRANRGDWLFLLAAVPAAMLLIAATFPPGSLWHTEGNGYDVLEYHLQLPREYALNNSTTPLHHNVYSFFPQNIEMLYLLLMQFAKTVMGNDRATGYLWGTFPAQFLHAILMLLTAAALALIPLDSVHPPPGETGEPSKDKPFLLATGRAIAVLLFLGTPWTIVTGSLAYNEAGMLFFGTLALGIALGAPPLPGRRGFARSILVGLLLGLAVGCKMTAGVFFALPVAVIYLLRATTDTSQLRHLATGTLLALVLYCPWAIRAAIHSGGNPVFPIATSLMPNDDWTTAQSQRFERGHAPPVELRPLSARLKALADNSLFDPQWSVQPYALLLVADEHPPAIDTLPKFQRLGLLWFALPLALVCAFISKPGRSDSALLLAVLLVQLLAWLFATHLQGRFLLPAAIPLALLAGRGVQGFHLTAEGITISALRIITGTIIGLHALATIFLLLPEANLFGGLREKNNQPAPHPPIGETIVKNVTAAVENPLGTRTPDQLALSRVLLLGDAEAFLYIGPVEYFTVFDTNPVLQSLDNPPATLHWLQQENVRYVYVDWLELARLQDSYGLDLAAPPRAADAKLLDRAEQIAAIYAPRLAAVGLQDTHADTRRGLTIYRVPP